MDELKARNMLDEFKQKRAEQAKEKRRRLKDGLAKCSKAIQKEIMTENRKRANERLKKHRQFKKENALNASDVPQSSGYKTKSALNKAVAKLKKYLPTSLPKQKEVAAKLFESLVQDELDENVTLNMSEQKSGRSVSKSLVTAVQRFYERDDISRISPNVRDSKYFVNQENGVKEIRQVRHLMYTLSKVYSLFIKQYVADGEYAIEAVINLRCRHFMGLSTIFNILESTRSDLRCIKAIIYSSFKIKQVVITEKSG